MLRIRTAAPALLLATALLSCGAPQGGQGGHNEPCYPNHTCDAGLVCLSEVCVVPTQLRGTEGGPCYDNGTCNDGLVCDDDVCVLDPTTGKLDGPCYANLTCDPGYECVDQVCEPSVGAPCASHDDCLPTLACYEGACADLVASLCEREATCEAGGGSPDECVEQWHDFYEEGAEDPDCATLLRLHKDVTVCFMGLPACAQANDACEAEQRAAWEEAAALNERTSGRCDALEP